MLCLSSRRRGRRPALVARGDQPVASEPPQPDKAEKLRRIVISITPEELERLCIAAIKTGCNRHDIVRGALNDYFRKLAAEFRTPAPAWKALPLLRHGTLNPRRGGRPVHILPVPKTRIRK